MTKYSAQKTTIDGITFDSKAEAARYSQLKLLERAKVIKGLACQPAYRLVVSGHEVCEYRGDFTYYEAGRLICEDVKGFATPMFRLKRKLFLALYPDVELRCVDKDGQLKPIRTRKASQRVAA